MSAAASSSPPPAAAASSAPAAASAASASAAAASSSAAAAAPAPGSPAPKGAKTPVKGAKPADVKALPIEEVKPCVFKSARAKKLFKLFDHDRDKFLNRSEFAAGLADFVSSPDLALTPAQIDALWAETHLSGNDKGVSWNEFAHRFCGGPHPSTLGKKVEKRASLMLQTPRKKEPPAGKAGSALAELRSVLEALYDGSKPRYPGVDLSKARALNPAAFKKLLNQTLSEEKAEAKAKKRPLEDWAVRCTASGSASDSKITDKLFNQMDDKKKGVVDLGPLFEQLKLRPSSKETGKGSGGAKAKSKKKAAANKGSGPQAYVLTSVKAEHVRDWVSELLLKNFPPNVGNCVKMHPALKHWGDDERRRKALESEGYKTIIFLSERTKVKAVVKLAPEVPEPGSPAAIAAAAAAAAAQGPLSPKTPKTPKTPKSPGNSSSGGASRAGTASASSAAAAAAAAAAAVSAPPVNHSDILIFASFRTEYTSMARQESLYHARLRLDEDEQVKLVEIREKKNWCDGELDKCASEAVFDDWNTYVPQEDEYAEMSIPPIA